MSHVVNRREAHFDKVIETACFEAGAVRTEMIKAIIATVNPEWDFSFFNNRTQRYGLTGLRLEHARGIEPHVSIDELINDPERCIRITARLLRMFVNYAPGYIGAVRMYGLSWEALKPHYLHFCNIANQPPSYLPAEVPGVYVRP